MEQRAADSGSELVLDNRKLIIAFVLLMVICGAFFIIGFMEGKRQGLQSRLETMPVSASTSIAETAEAQGEAGTEKPIDAEPAVDEAAAEKLDWYQKVNQPDASAAAAPKPQKTVQTRETAAQPKREAPAKAASEAPAAASADYRVQVGAFRQKEQAELLVDTLESKGYACNIESPGTPNGLHLVTVGSFDTRAEAVAIQLRLKRDGYGSFIRTK